MCNSTNISTFTFWQVKGQQPKGKSGRRSNGVIDKSKKQIAFIHSDVQSHMFENELSLSTLPLSILEIEGFRLGRSKNRPTYDFWVCLETFVLKLCQGVPCLMQTLTFYCHLKIKGDCMALPMQAGITDMVYVPKMLPGGLASTGMRQITDMMMTCLQHW